MRFIDITEEVKDDHELQIAQIRMLAILESTEDANLLLSPEGKLLSINRKASEVMMRWLHVHLVEDCDVLDLLKKQKSFDFGVFFQKSLSGEFVSFELKIHSFEGSDNWYSVRLFPAKNPMGVVIGVSFNLTDINTHKVAELQLIETEKKLIALFNSAPEAHIFFDVHGKVRFFNRLVQQLPLYLREPLPVSVGKHLNQLGFLLPETQLEEILALTLKGESTYQLLELANHQDETFWWEIKTYPAIGQQGNLLGAVWRIDNVSENHQSRLEIIERQEQLRELARIHSHEVRKPLANVLALLDMISNQTSVNHKQDDTLRQYLSNQIAELDSIIHHLSSKNTSNSL
jgi:PAS domain S-box-containing protein